MELAIYILAGVVAVGAWLIASEIGTLTATIRTAAKAEQDRDDDARRTP